MGGCKYQRVCCSSAKEWEVNLCNDVGRTKRKSMFSGAAQSVLMPAVLFQVPGWKVAKALLAGGHKSGPKAMCVGACAQSILFKEPGKGHVPSMQRLIVLLNMLEEYRL